MKPTQIQGSISKISSMSGGAMRIQFDTQQNIDPEIMKYFFEQIEKYGWITHNASVIEVEDIASLPAVKKEAGKKSQSQRLRDVYFLLWQQNKESYDDFNDYYKYKMELLIEHFKKQIE
ncbi:MAG: hypothetical protein GY853_06695 [PVC group bacterium]|nr:hypothetical protein [PVC group bacterium]